MNGLVASAIGTAAVAAAALGGGAWRWSASTRHLRARLDAARRQASPSTLNLNDVDGLPTPVGRYLRAVLRERARFVSEAHIRQRGSLNLGEAAERWRPFTSEQRVVTQRPGFDWDARVSLMPGLVVRVRDAYVEGEGVLRAAVGGLWTIAEQRGTPELAEGELMRFLAEAVWYPTALLPSQGMSWHEVDARSARATLVDGEHRTSLLFEFNDEGLVETVHADARWRTVGRDLVPTPWRGRFWNYQKRAGMLVPSSGEVAWLLPGGPRPYWRGEIQAISYLP